MANAFQKLAETAQSIAEARDTKAKIALCAHYFQSLKTAEDLQLASCFLGEGAFPSLSEKRAVVGSRTYATSAADFCEINYEKVFKPSKKALGDSPETIERLMHNIEAARQKRKPTELSLAEVEAIYEIISKVSSGVEKQKILQSAWQKMTPIEIKYFLRIMGRGSLHIGLETLGILSAIAEAFNKKLKDVRYVHMITGSIGRTAVLCQTDRLDEAAFKRFHPFPFMLASPVRNRNPADLNQYIAEENLGGMRSQLHIGKGRVKLYSRNLNDITLFFPEITDPFKKRGMPNLVLDGVICAYKNDTILPLPVLQKRMSCKKPSKKVVKEIPALFIAFDILFYDGEPIFNEPLIKRRQLLEKVSAQHHILITNQFEVDNRDRVNKLFKQSLAHGNTGLILKVKNSAYEYAQRTKSWLAMKEAGGTLHAIIMYAHAKPGKRGDLYADFTLGIRVNEDERYEEEFIPIGKIHGGYTGKKIKELNKRIKELTIEKYGPTLGLLPEIVVELEFDAIEINKRTKANYTLQSPHFKAVRWDLTSNETDTLREVERIYEEKITRKRLKQDKNPSFYFEQ